PAACYIGFDPTASSLHVGHLIPIMALSQMQKNGHKPIALVGGGTGLVGDPSGKTETRQMLTEAIVEENVAALKTQLSRFIDFQDDRALILNNAAWLGDLKYIHFLREIGRHFSVNRMIKSEGYRMRLEAEEGLNFIEFNYMLLQAYDFLELFDRHQCRLQMGGSDQWGNIVAGIDLIRKMRQQPAFGITFPLITTASGAKMGKTAKGAVWLDPSRTTPYEYYQFWINTDDKDVIRFLKLFTFLPIEEIKEVESLSDAALNAAKTILAFEATAIVHDADAAIKAYQSSMAVFGDRPVPLVLLPSSRIPRTGMNRDDQMIPRTKMDRAVFEQGIPAFRLFCDVGLTGSGGAARRLIEQGGAYVNGNRVSRFDKLITLCEITNNELLLAAGKKQRHKIEII
ncbi:MAG TPA: tyrosine--tRNA ligase, partial [Desulfatirhabdiaceae bacterium]|nr:tyrosine--tRNA ligase [Desulfatirhabdiaceae bacterium]